MIPVLYQDQHLIAVHKPSGLLVHRSALSRDKVFLLQTLRDQINQRVYPVHRLDRATSGVMVFGLHSEAAQKLVQQFEARTVKKSYRALARGWLHEAGLIDHPVADEESRQAAQTAQTAYRPLARIELPFAVDRYPSSRYCLLDVQPFTGRRHQIRKHFKHISHHLIGDTTHGNGKHNRFFREHFNIHRLMLSAWTLSLQHPYSGETLQLQAHTDAEWRQLAEQFAWQDLFPNPK